MSLRLDPTYIKALEYARDEAQKELFEAQKSMQEARKRLRIAESRCRLQHTILEQELALGRGIGAIPVQEFQTAIQEEVDSARRETFGTAEAPPVAGGGGGAPEQRPEVDDHGVQLPERQAGGRSAGSGPGKPGSDRVDHPTAGRRRQGGLSRFLCQIGWHLRWQKGSTRDVGIPVRKCRGCGRIQIYQGPINGWSPGGYDIGEYFVFDDDRK